MAQDHELPVWGVRPNWSQSIIETLTWQTDVLQSLSGAEQRLALRVAPRRMFEARYNPYENERTFVDLAMHRLFRNEWMMPLWFDRATLSAPAIEGASRLLFDTTEHEFAEGGMAYLVGPDTFTGEAVRIAAIDADGIDLVAPINAAWGAGTSIHPMRRGWFEEGGHALLTSRLGESNIRFHVIEGNDLSDEGTWVATHEGTPVLLDQPDWSNNIEIDLSFLGDEFDSLTGLKRVTDTSGRTFRQQQHAFFLHGKAEQFAFRQMLYRLRGQQKALWLPTFADDIEVALPGAAGATALNIKQIGLTYVGGPSDGRDRIVFSDGQIVKIDSSLVVSGTSNERLNLASGLAAAKVAGERASFVEKVRLAQDSVEIEHVGDTDGFARSTLSFKAVADRRVATDAVQAPPIGVMNNNECGSPAIESACTTFFNPVFEGWLYRVILTMSGNIRTINSATLFIGVSDGTNSSGSGAFYYETDGQYIEGGPNNQYHVINQNLVYWYTSIDFAALELLIQMQNMGGSSNRASIGRWDEVSSGDLVTRQSQIIAPGVNSTFGNGITNFPAPPDSFIATHYFGI